jgi:hypothetical protein
LRWGWRGCSSDDNNDFYNHDHLNDDYNWRGDNDDFYNHDHLNDDYNWRGDNDDFYNHDYRGRNDHHFAIDLRPSLC